MGTILNNDDNIWFKHIHADPKTMTHLRQIPGGARVSLEIEGTSGEWERAKDGSDGRPTMALKPVGPTVAFWKAMKPRRGEWLKFKLLDRRDAYLADIQSMLSEWQSPEDEMAFRDL
jgi:hypothetical protein